MDLKKESDNPCPAGIVAIAINPKSKRQHSGLVFESRAGSVQLCDLRYHHKLVVRNVPGQYFWTKVRLSDHEASQIAEFVELILEHHNAGRPIPYSFEYRPDAFDVTGTLRQGVPGLTCATFIVSVFERFKLPLIDVSTWRPRTKEDGEFRRTFIQGAIENGADELMIFRLVGENPDFRIKPYEVCGAATHDKYPVRFAVAVRLAAEVERIVTDAALPPSS